jgi:hypothetical protein
MKNIVRKTEEECWLRIYKKGQKTALDFKITSKEDIDHILHAPQTKRG